MKREINAQLAIVIGGLAGSSALAIVADASLGTRVLSAVTVPLALVIGALMVRAWRKTRESYKAKGMW